MVLIDTVYQRVLSLANKEQRGYITPQEFNLFANQAQIEVYEQYHYDVNYLEMRDTTNSINSDVTDLTRQKLDIFLTVLSPSVVGTFIIAGSTIQLPNYIYRLSRVQMGSVSVEYLDNHKFTDAITSGPLTKPTQDRPVYTQNNNSIRVNNGNPVTSGVGLHYYRVPDPVSWGYFVLSGKALYDSSTAKTKNFELHRSDETELVYKILKFAGVSMSKLDIMRAGQVQEQSQQQQEKQ